MAAAAIDIYGRAARLADHRRHWPPAQYATWLSDQLDHAANKVTEPM